MLLMGKLTISMAIVNSYVKLPEGKSGKDQLSLFHKVATGPHVAQTSRTLLRSRNELRS